MAYPLFLHLEAARCLVVGAGKVAHRKLAGLLDAGAQRITVIAPSATEDIRPLLGSSSVVYKARAFATKDIEGCLLVFAATNVREVNAAVARLCRENTILCSVADAPDEGTFISPASLERPGLQIAVSSNGISPALTARIKNELDAWMGHRYDCHIALLTKIRPLVLESGGFSSHADRAEALRFLAGPQLGEALLAKNTESCLALLRNCLPPSLHARCEEIVHELV